MKMKSLVLCFIFIIIVINGCNRHLDKSTILTKHLQELLQDNYQENANYIVINTNGCLGCISKNILFLKNNTHILHNYKGLITTELIIEQFPYIKNLPIDEYIDTSNVLETLNTGVTGLSTVTIKDNKVVRLLNSNVLVTSDDSKMNTFFKTERGFNSSSSTFIELFRKEFEQKFPIRKLDSNNLNRETLIFFTSDHCSPCKKVFPIIDSLSMIYNDSIDFYFIKSDKKDNMKVFNEYNINATPTIVIFKLNQPMIHKIGLRNKKEIIKDLFED